ncbi:hypothetical protein [Saccharothrix obliqua]|uniref:hypothetical protein n=1 Tax=Saccharothrix obliqua TaxID=2861747 RepID=UPI001C5F18A0|nr:hypothetical protein [Saccharothrix obliqua]MBW4717230.1 hypothetical protein [Saccharothrix obliqua]
MTNRGDLRRRLAHVRWIAGGTGAGKSTVTRLLAERHGAVVYDGDAAERAWVPRFTPDRHPRAWAALRLTPEQRAQRTPEETYREMPSLHGETIDLLVADLLALPDDRPVLVDYFGNTPRDIAPLLTRRTQAIFLLPTPGFRRHALTTRFADPARAHANWGSGDHTRALANRLARDTLWDAELRRQATELDLPTLTVDGTRTADAVATHLSHHFRLTTPPPGGGH